MKSSFLRLLTLLTVVGAWVLPAIGNAADSADKKPAATAEKAKPKKPDSERKRPGAVRLRELQQQLDAARKELEQARGSLHEAHKELGAKAETISSLEAKLSSLTKQLEKTQADLKKAGDAVAGLAKSQHELEEERKKVAALRDELKAVQGKAAEALSKAKAEASKKVAAPTPAAPAKKAAPAKAKAPSIAPIAYAKCSAVNYPERARALGEVRAALKQSPQAKVFITGFADDSRYAQTNQDVSENRARFLAAYFVSQGIPEDRVQTRGLGNSRPVKGQPNRRAEIEIRP